MEVASNPNTPIETLKQLALDKNYDVNLPVFIDDVERFITFCTPNLGGFSMSTNDTGYSDIETELIVNKIEMQHNKYMRNI